MDHEADIESVIHKLESSLPICRVCLETCMEYIEFEGPLCAVNGQEKSYCDGFTELTKPFTDLPDNSPTNFCVNCGKDLLGAYLFLKRVENANFILSQAKYFQKESTKCVDYKDENILGTELEDCTENLNVVYNETKSFSEKSSVLSYDEDFKFPLDEELRDFTENPKCHAEIDTSTKKGMHEESAPNCKATDPLQMRSKNDLYQIDPPNTPKKELTVDDDDSLSDESSIENFFVDGKSNWKCDKCENICESKSQLTEHRKIHKLKDECLTKAVCSSEKKLNQCPVCKRYCRSGPQFLDHLNVHSGEKPYTCNICLHTFHTKRNLLLHDWRTHKHPERRRKRRNMSDSPVKEYIDEQTGKKKFICSICEKHFISKCGLKAHALSHKRGEFVCNICNKICLTQFTLKRHIGYMHLTDRMKYQCEDCGLFFQYPSVLKEHQRKHNIDNMLQCPCCDKSFFRKLTLEIHLRYHNNEFDFKCEQCDKSYVTERALLDHVKTKHTDCHITYDCDKCDQKFKSRTGLKKHTFTHTSFPFNCPMCGMGQAARSGMKAHMLRVHKDNVTEEDFNSMFPTIFPTIGYARPRKYHKSNRN